MATLTIRELNANVSSAIARVEGGETIYILKNNRTVAELRPKANATNDDPLFNKANHDTVDFFRRGLSLGGIRPSIEDRYGDVEL